MMDVCARALVGASTIFLQLIRIQFECMKFFALVILRIRRSSFILRRIHSECEHVLRLHFFISLKFAKIEKPTKTIWNSNVNKRF